MIQVKADAARLILDQVTNGVACYVCEFHVQVVWPQIVDHDGRRYTKTGKEGTRLKDGIPSAEYQANKQQRVWLGLDGLVVED